MNQTDIGKARNVVGRTITDIRIDGKEIWLDFQDGGRAVFRVKSDNDGNLYSEEFRVLVDNEIVHRHQIFEIDLRNYRKQY